MFQKKPKTKRVFKKKPCSFCVEKMDYVDYKNLPVLKKFINSHGKILPSRVSDTCARHQRLVSTAIKRARFIALLPYSLERVRK